MKTLSCFLASVSLIACAHLTAQPQRIVAIGDLHGDPNMALQALQLAGAVDTAGHWIGGDRIIVQTGDEIDRGDGDRQVIDLFERLRIEAKAAGGAVHALIGNHEAMNIYRDFRYVSAEAFADFTLHLPSTVQPFPDLPVEQQARAAAFSPGGSYAQILATRPLMLVLGDTVFVHGGLRPEHVQMGLEAMNHQAATWMRGDGERPSFVKDPKGPLWMRDYSQPQPTAEACALLEETLKALGVKRMVVGHTIQDGGISAACDDKVWRIDVGMSAYYKKKIVAVLEIKGDEVRKYEKREHDRDTIPDR